LQAARVFLQPIGADTLMSKPVRAVVMDLEGTAVPTRFMTETLVPFARDRLGNYIKEHGADEDLEEAQLVQRRQRHDREHLVDHGVGHLLVEEIRHRVDEGPRRRVDSQRYLGRSSSSATSPVQAASSPFKVAKPSPHPPDCEFCAVAVSA
jgi:hypothetical protein